MVRERYFIFIHTDLVITGCEISKVEKYLTFPS